ncbi:uncharacterized protein L969DRAFT_119958 [Mixia osmundae IAM 14324]|uniref:DUF218 domain-containing protein n=1 Tax=Mixia osmundae (strain CBS 9802 / IAM 14324 / JCM 22182 / KY 12970) TaxID=764103 RepID=G7E3V7_MIXOS|nr:uncharacterized protein L969DRAFT_119958 [Mixia osmundae IAM 14324]KEI41962.1 hypothetical protein L969DRAFT_119958 [Mixia osmundae IAM 14324]GAA97517.1 hypothetical protein E5Q_04195 [Mixia osmundae IAM 14324]
MHRTASISRPPDGPRSDLHSSRRASAAGRAHRPPPHAPSAPADEHTQPDGQHIRPGGHAQADYSIAHGPNVPAVGYSAPMMTSTDLSKSSSSDSGYNSHTVNGHAPSMNGNGSLPLPNTANRSTGGKMSKLGLPGLGGTRWKRTPNSSADYGYQHVPNGVAETIRDTFLVPAQQAGTGWTRHQAAASIGPSSSKSSWLNLLSARARVTNLAVLVLGAITMVSLIVNISHFSAIEHDLSDDLKTSRIPLSIRSTLQPAAVQLRHMIMVPGHAIWTGSDGLRAYEDSQWVLEDMQKGGHVKTYVKHIARAVDLAIQDPLSLLIFSGGQTRPTTQMTEGASYWRLAEALNLYEQYSLQHNATQGGTQEQVAALKAIIPHPFPRAVVEDYALDSYTNLLFATARFKQFTGHYPTHITVVGYGAKQKRFSDVHRVAMRWPQSAWTYIPIDDDKETGALYEGERLHGLLPYQNDIYGCHTELLAKRKKRNPYRRFHPYHVSNPELDKLMEWCPDDPTQIYTGSLPWSQMH